MRLRNLILSSLVAVSAFTASEASAARAYCQDGWYATAGWWTSAYGVTTAELYLLGSDFPILVESHRSEAVTVGGGTMVFGTGWDTVLDGDYLVVFHATIYPGLDHVPTPEELAAFPPGNIRYLSGQTYLSCVGPEPVCGNGIVEAGEACDDGNLVAGDGCSAICTREPFGCTYTLGYWKNHNEHELKPNRQIAWPISADTMMCGHTWLQILKTSPRGNAWYILAHQWIAARLDIANGGSLSVGVVGAVQEAGQILADCSVTSAERTRALDLASLLDNYNNGALPPGHCD